MASLQLCGLLDKQKSNCLFGKPGFVRRWFVVSQGALEVFDIEARIKKAKYTDIRGCACTDEARFEFVVLTSMRSLTLRASSRDELRRWLGGLSALVKQPKEQQPQAAHAAVAIQNESAATLRNLASMEHMPAAATEKLAAAAVTLLTRVDINAVPAFAAVAAALHAETTVCKPVSLATAAPPRPLQQAVSIFAPLQPPKSPPPPPPQTQQQQQQQPGTQRENERYLCGAVNVVQADRNWLEDDFDA